jgi:hypothetical protein
MTGSVQEYRLGRVLLRIVPGLLFGIHQATAWQALADEPTELRESLPAGSRTQVRIELKAEGLFRPGISDAALRSEGKMPKPLALDVQTRLIFTERLLASGSDPDNPENSPQPTGSRPTAPKSFGKAVRWVSQAAAAINGEVRPTASVLRPGLKLLVAQLDSARGAVVVVSPAGPMTRAELELVQGLGDPLTLANFLSPEPVIQGSTWKLSKAAAVSLSGYDAVNSSTLQGTLEQLDGSAARIRLRGEVNGSALGGSGTITCEGSLNFDRAAGLVDRLEVNRVENRRPGPVEAGLDVKSTLRVVRRPIRSAPELEDSAISGFTLDTSPPHQLLQLISPDRKYNLLHDRHWHTYWDDRKLVVLKRLENDKVVAQCNLAAGPSAGKGKHQDLAQFRDDLRHSLKQRFVQFLGAGEVGGDPAGGFRYKVSVQGREGDLGVIWNYYLIASPEGDQLLATFTLAEEDAASFGSQDLEIIGSLQWYSPSAAPAKP